MTNVDFAELIKGVLYASDPEKRQAYTGDLGAAVDTLLKFLDLNRNNSIVISTRIQDYAQCGLYDILETTLTRL